MGLLKPVFKSLTGVALATAMAMPALAQDAANDAPVVNASVATTTMTKPQFVNVSDWNIGDARVAAAAASSDKVAIVVWGGTKELQYEAFLAAQDLVNEGIPAAFVIAPDTNGHTADAYFEVFAKSAPKGDSTFGVKNAHLVRQDMYDGAKSAYNSTFPVRVAELDLR